MLNLQLLFIVNSFQEHVWARNFLKRASIFLKFCMHVELIMSVFSYPYINYLCPTDFASHTLKIKILKHQICQGYPKKQSCQVSFNLVQ